MLTWGELILSGVCTRAECSSIYEDWGFRRISYGCHEIVRRKVIQKIGYRTWTSCRSDKWEYVHYWSRLAIDISKGNGYLPTMFSRTDDFPADCDPTTTIWGKSTVCWPIAPKTSCSLLTIGISWSIVKVPPQKWVEGNYCNRDGMRLSSLQI